MFDLAREINATLVAVNLRFYGNSRPTNDTSLPNLRFLSSDQILADIAHLVYFIKTSNASFTNSKVIAFGNEYGASLATWMRQKYPHLIDGAWASSALLRAVYDFTEQNENVANTLVAIGGLRCYRQLERAYEQIEELIQLGDFETLDRKFNLCTPLTNDPFELSSFIAGLAVSYELKFMMGKRSDVDRFCTYMTEDSEDDPLTRYAIHTQEIFQGLPCIATSHAEIVGIHKDEEWDTMSTLIGGRQSVYQSCHEFSHFSSTTSPYQPFGNRIQIDFYISACGYLFGDDFSVEFLQERVRRTNLIFGGANPNVTNVFFTHGEMDPKRTSGRLSDLNPSSPAVVIPDYSASQDFGSLNPAEDTFFMHQTKLRVRELVRLWISD